MKKTRLVTTISMCVLCLSFLVVGVWAAASSVNFSLSGNLQFYPEGVYVELSGQVYRGTSANEEDLKELTSSSRFTLNSITNFDNSTGEPSGNFPIESWNIENLTFTPTDRFIKVEVKIKNHSSFPIAISPNVLLNNENISSSTFTNLTITESEANEITASSGETATYYVMFEIDADATQISGNNLSLSFDIIKAYVYKVMIVNGAGFDILDYVSLYDDGVMVSLMYENFPTYYIDIIVSEGSVLTLVENSNSSFSVVPFVSDPNTGGISVINSEGEYILDASYISGLSISQAEYTVNGK